MRILVVNAGSSSLKLRGLDERDRIIGDHELSAPGGRFVESEAAAALGSLGPVDAVGHRVVHGGHMFSRAVRLDQRVEAQLRALVDLAPLHEPAAVAGIDLVGRLMPDTPAVACFDTAFHSGMPAAAATYAIPGEWRERYGIRRYGFHGLSHAYASRRAAELLGRPASSLRIITCHLGAGASLAAVHGGRSVDTTMGFTPLEGLVMATRSGTVDPGLVLWLQDRARIGAREMTDALEHRSGLLALAGTSDMREVLSAAAAGNSDARSAIDVYVHRLRGAVAAMAAAMNGLDALVFTGGVGERAAPVRAAAADGLAFLGVTIDQAANAAATRDADVTAAGARVRTLVLRAREDLQIAGEVRSLLRRDRGGAREAGS